MVFKWLKDYYLTVRYGFKKRPARFKIQGILTVAPLRLRHDDSAYSKAAIIDISRSGISIESFSEFKIYDEIILQFTLPSHYVSISGIIVRMQHQASTFIYGIKFHTDAHNLGLAKLVLDFAKSEFKKYQANQA